MGGDNDESPSAISVVRLNCKLTYLSQLAIKENGASRHTFSVKTPAVVLSSRHRIRSVDAVRAIRNTVQVARKMPFLNIVKLEHL
jgi:hypothetical protein